MPAQSRRASSFSGIDRRIPALQFSRVAGAGVAARHGSDERTGPKTTVSKVFLGESFGIPGLDRMPADGQPSVDRHYNSCLRRLTRTMVHGIGYGPKVQRGSLRFVLA